MPGLHRPAAVAACARRRPARAVGDGRRGLAARGGQPESVGVVNYSYLQNRKTITECVLCACDEIN